jgi:anti-anti-sigma factor
MADSGSCLTVERRGDVDIVRFKDGRFVGTDKLEELSECLDTLIQGRKVLLLVMDFTGLRQVSSGLLGLLASLHLRLRKLSGRLCVCGVEDRVMEVLRGVELDKVLAVYGTDEEAVAALGGG